MNRTTISLFWQFIDRFSVQGIQFLIGIVLSRLLSPNDYGIIGIIMVFFYLL
ncbi:oligosaccharide flippase family protein [Bacteroides fragilis]